MRYAGTTISGALAGMGGFVYSLTTANCTANGDVAGFGFLALAVMIFGNWNILPTALVCLFFGLAKSGGYQLCLEMGLPSNYSDLFMMLPYILTLLLLVFFSKKNHPPAAAGDKRAAERSR